MPRILRNTQGTNVPRTTAMNAASVTRGREELRRHLGRRRAQGHHLLGHRPRRERLDGGREARHPQEEREELHRAAR